MLIKLDVRQCKKRAERRETKERKAPPLVRGKLPFGAAIVASNADSAVGGPVGGFLSIDFFKASWRAYIFYDERALLEYAYVSTNGYQ